jgi:hypothetical protein
MKRSRPEVPVLRQRLQDLGSQADSFLMQQSRGATDLTTLLGVAAGSWGIETLLVPGTVSRWQGMTLVYWGYNILRR